uniref:Uncharacterized protein n=1 Tax=Timema cristinae TaxID=61476 RepID=A0A7R9CEV2_TIMCR|nr:unnamed protein product [Timema cristinae]
MVYVRLSKTTAYSQAPLRLNDRAASLSFTRHLLALVVIRRNFANSPPPNVSSWRPSPKTVLTPTLFYECEACVCQEKYKSKIKSSTLIYTDCIFRNCARNIPIIVPFSKQHPVDWFKTTFVEVGQRSVAVKILSDKIIELAEAWDKNDIFKENDKTKKDRNRKRARNSCTCSLREEKGEKKERVREGEGKIGRPLSPLSFLGFRPTSVAELANTLVVLSSTA